MIKVSKIGESFKQKLFMQYSPVGFYYADKKPKESLGFKKAGNDCIKNRGQSPKTPSAWNL